MGECYEKAAILAHIQMLQKLPVVWHLPKWMELVILMCPTMFGTTKVRPKFHLGLMKSHSVSILYGIYLTYRNLGPALLTLKSFYLKAFSRKHGCDWLMLKHQPITATLSAKSRTIRTSCCRPHFQMHFLNRNFVFWSKFYWILLFSIQIIQYWFSHGLLPNKRPTIAWNNGNPVHICLYGRCHWTRTYLKQCSFLTNQSLRNINLMIICLIKKIPFKKMQHLNCFIKMLAVLFIWWY